MKFFVDVLAVGAIWLAINLLLVCIMEVISQC